MKPISCNQEIGDTERLLCSGGPQDLAGFYYLPLSMLYSWDSQVQPALKGRGLSSTFWNGESVFIN